MQPTIILGLPFPEVISHQDDSTNGMVNFKSGRWMALTFWDPEPPPVLVSRCGRNHNWGYQHLLLSGLIASFQSWLGYQACGWQNVKNSFNRDKYLEDFWHYNLILQLLLSKTWCYQDLYHQIYQDLGKLKRSRSVSKAYRQLPITALNSATERLKNGRYLQQFDSQILEMAAINQAACKNY